MTVALSEGRSRGGRGHRQGPTGWGAQKRGEGRAERFCEVLRVQGLSGGAQDGVAPVLAGAGAEEGFEEVAARDLVFVEGPLRYVGLQVVS